MVTIKTRFAPSPTGFLHIGGARTALFAWAYARKHNGQFILRIEDTDLERSTQASVESILAAMRWLNLNYDLGPYYQTKRMSRYQEVIEQLLKDGQAYYCYCSKEELEQMRETQKAQGLKPKYDRRCLHKHTQQPELKPNEYNTNDTLSARPVVRFKNPDAGNVVWHDLVKGTITISNSELDDLIIARSDGSPTYNFCVAVDDMDMDISHVIRGDDHVNNTPRQINILQALKAQIPQYAHVPMILNVDGQKMSKRMDAVSVMQYQAMGILPEALLNYLARLCFGHGNDEVFSVEQFKQWFALDHISSSAARFDIQKLLWLNAEHLKLSDDAHLATLLHEYWQTSDAKMDQLIAQFGQINLKQIISQVKSRVNTLNTLADECKYFYQPLAITPEDKAKHLTLAALALLNTFAHELAAVPSWSQEQLHEFINDFCKRHNCKMPQLGMPLRLALCGTTRTISLDCLLYLLGYEVVVNRIKQVV